MEICEKRHEEIVYLGEDCPICKLLMEIEGLEDELNAAAD